MSGRQLPRGWDERVDEKSGRTYYVNHETRQTSWTLPSEKPLPPGWEQQYDEKGRVFFINHEREITTWTDPRNVPQQPQAQSQPQAVHRQSATAAYSSPRPAPSIANILKPGTLIKVHKSAVEALAAMVLGYDPQQGTHSIALENGHTDNIDLSSVSHETIEDLMERIARFFVICEQAHQAFPPNSAAIELALVSIAITLKDWMSVYTSVDGSHGSIDRQQQLGQILSYFMDQRAALVLTKAMELGGALGEAAIQCLAEINNVLRLADPDSVANVSIALQEAGVTRGLVYLLRGGTPELCVKILHVVSFFSGDVNMVRSFETSGGVVLLCELLVNAEIQQHAVTVLQQMLAVDKDNLVKVILESGGLQYLYLVLESSIGHVQREALLVLQDVFASSNSIDVSSSGIVQPLVRIVSNGGDAAPLAVEMLVPLARSSQTATALVDAGCVNSLVSLCQSGRATDNLRVQAFELLHSIAVTNTRCVQQLSQSAAPQMLLDVVGNSLNGGASNHPLTSAALLLLADLCDNERVCAAIRTSGGVDVLVSCLQSAVPPACKEAAVEILATIGEGDASVAELVASSGAAEASIALLTGKSAKAKAFIGSLLNRTDVLESTMASLRSNEPLLTLMVKGFVNQLRTDPSNHEPVFSLEKFCTLPDDGHVMLQMRRLQIANAAGAIPALIKLIREAGPLPMKMAAMSSIAELAKDPTTCSVLEEANAFTVICTGLMSWELPQLQEVALTILQCMFSGGLTLKTIKEAETLAKALAACVVKDHVEVQTLALRLCEPLCGIEQYRVEIGHILAPSLASLFDSGAGQMLDSELRNSTISTLAALAADRRTVDALVAADSVKAVAKILTSTMEEDVLASVLDMLVQVASTGATGCAAVMGAHENDLTKFVELLPPTPLQTEEVTSRALRLLTVLSQQPGSMDKVMAIDGFLDKMLGSCQDDAFPEYRTVLLSIAQSKPNEAGLVWEGVQRRVDVTAALVLLDSKAAAVKTRAIEALAAACTMRPEHAVARIVESGKIQAITAQLQSTNQEQRQATMTVIGACASDSSEARDVLVQNLQVLVRLLLSYSTPVVASAISVLRQLAKHSEDFWPEVLRASNRKLVIDCLAGLFARQNLDPTHRVEVSRLLTELLGRIDVLSDAERNVVSHTLHSTLTILKETDASHADATTQLHTLNQLLQKVPSCKSQLLRYPWLLPRLVRAAGDDSGPDSRRVGTQLLRAYVESQAVKNDSIQLLVEGGGLADLHHLLEQNAANSASGNDSQDDASAEHPLVLPVKLVAEVAVGPASVRLELFDSDIGQWLLHHVGAVFSVLIGVKDTGDDDNDDDDTAAPQAFQQNTAVAQAIFKPCVEALCGLAAVGSLRPKLAASAQCAEVLCAYLSVGGATVGNDKSDFFSVYQSVVPEVLATLRYLAPFLDEDGQKTLSDLLVNTTIPFLLAPVLKAGANASTGDMQRLHAGLATLTLFAASGVTPGGALVGDSGQLLVSLLQLVASQPTTPAAFRALKLVRMSLLSSPGQFASEVLARGGVDRLGSALAKAKRGGSHETVREVLRTIRILCTQAVAVEYFVDGKSPAVYGIIRSLANAKTAPETPQANNSETAAFIVGLIGKDVRSRTEERLAAQKKVNNSGAPPAIGSPVVHQINKEPAPPSYRGSAAPTSTRPYPSRAVATVAAYPPASVRGASSTTPAPPSYAPPPSHAPPPAPTKKPEVRVTAPKTSFMKPHQPLAARSPSDPTPAAGSTSRGAGASVATVQVPALNIGDSANSPNDPPPPPASSASASQGPSYPAGDSSGPTLPKPYKAPLPDGSSSSSSGTTASANLGPPKYEPPPSFSRSSTVSAPVGTGLPAPAGSYHQPREPPRFYQDPAEQSQSLQHDPYGQSDPYGPHGAYEASTHDPYESAPAPAAGSSSNVEPGDSEDMRSLLALGFDRDQCAIALAQTDGKVDQAAAILFGEEIDPDGGGGSAAAAASVPADPDDGLPLEVPTFDEGVRMNGLLMKRSAHLKQWRQRFLVLKGNRLYSFKNKGEYEISAAADRPDLHNVYKIVPGTTVGEVNEKPNSFQITLGPGALEPDSGEGAAASGKPKPKSTETELFLAATDAGLRKRWMDAIRKVVTDLAAVADTKEAVEMREKVGVASKVVCVVCVTELSSVI
eukprot:INCI9980.1.p1 GENE.INCI9980.1~~INCI9980.1.p1  ORF type:complete len:2208 (-),score=428.99 INCI9980.1:1729-8187(-)